MKKKLQHYLSAKEFLSILPSGSQPGKFHGLAKVHKDGTPPRPVVSLLGLAEYHLAKYLGSIINGNMPNRYMFDSNVSFISQLYQFSFIPSHVLVSYGVESLFMNITLQETIENVCKHVYKHFYPPKYPIEIFRMLLQIVTGGYFKKKYFFTAK